MARRSDFERRTRRGWTLRIGANDEYLLTTSDQFSFSAYWLTVTNQVRDNVCYKDCCMLIDCLEVAGYSSGFFGSIAYVYRWYAHRWHTVHYLARTDWCYIVLHIEYPTSVSRLI
jgi:hypothetical protein